MLHQSKMTSVASPATANAGWYVFGVSATSGFELGLTYLTSGIRQPKSQNPEDT